MGGWCTQVLNLLGSYGVPSRVDIECHRLVLRGDTLRIVMFDWFHVRFWHQYCNTIDTIIVSLLFHSVEGEI